MSKDKAREFAEYIKQKNRFFIPNELKDEIVGFVDYFLEKAVVTLIAGEYLYRARIQGVDQDKPFPPDKLGMPPNLLASAGRINPEGISCFYSARQKQAAIAEVRPWVGAKIDVAEFSVNESFAVVSFRHEDISIRQGGAQMMVRDILGGVYAHEPMNALFGIPVHGSDKHSYLPTQWISEYIKSKGFNGIQYDSVLHDRGVNVALFSQDKLNFNSIETFEIKSVHYESAVITSL